MGMRIKDHCSIVPFMTHFKSPSAYALSDAKCAACKASFPLRISAILPEAAEKSLIKSDFSQQISAPEGIGFSGVISASSPFSSSAQSSMPSETMPASFAGFRFTSTITFLPTISWAV